MEALICKIYHSKIPHRYVFQIILRIFLSKTIYLTVRCQWNVYGIIITLRISMWHKPILKWLQITCIPITKKVSQEKFKYYYSLFHHTIQCYFQLFFRSLSLLCYLSFSFRYFFTPTCYFTYSLDFFNYFYSGKVWSIHKLHNLELHYLSQPNKK